MSTKIQINLLQYQGYLCFLNDFVKLKKQNCPEWSLGVWAKALGLKSTSSISKILKNERAPGEKITNSLVDYFNFNEKERLYFNDLISLEKTKDNSPIKSILKSRIAQNGHNKEIQILEMKTFEVISSWFHLALRQMTRLKKFKLDTTWISNQFIFKVNDKEIQTALNTLERVGLVSIQKNKVSLKSKSVSTSEDIKDLAIQNYHKSMLSKAKSSIDLVPVKNREILSGTLCFNKNDMPKAKELLRNFLNEFGETMDSQQANEIYQVQLQFFPLTQIEKEQ